MLKIDVHRPIVPSDWPNRASQYADRCIPVMAQRGGHSRVEKNGRFFIESPHRDTPVQARKIHGTALPWPGLPPTRFNHSRSHDNVLSH